MSLGPQAGPIAGVPRAEVRLQARWPVCPGKMQSSAPDPSLNLEPEPTCWSQPRPSHCQGATVAPGLTRTLPECSGKALSPWAAPQAGRPGAAERLLPIWHGPWFLQCKVKLATQSRPMQPPPPPWPPARRHPPHPVLRRGHRGTRVEQRPLVHCGALAIDSNATNWVLCLVCSCPAPRMPLRVRGPPLPGPWPGPQRAHQLQRHV